MPGPWEWDVKRLAASLEVAGRGNGYPSGLRRKVVPAAVGRYREAMRGFAGQGNLAVWYARAETEALREQFGLSWLPVSSDRRTRPWPSADPGQPAGAGRT